MLYPKKPQANQAAKKNPKTLNPQKDKPQVWMVSEVKMGGSFWASVGMKDVFTVREHCEKKQTKKKKIYQNFEELWIV